MFFATIAFLFQQCRAYHTTNPWRGRVHFERCSLNPFHRRDLSDFYRANFHARRNTKWVPSLPESDDGDGEKYSFLRSLCVSREHRRGGLALRLLAESIRDFDAQYCYCFAGPGLETLYHQSDFRKISRTDTPKTATLPKWLVQSYNSMEARWTSKGLGPLHLFVRTNPVLHTDNPEIILLQHSSEMSKKTATGWLLDDHMYSERFPCNAKHDNNDLKLQLQRWIWSGRDDASKIEEKLTNLMEDRNVHLLWTGNSTNEHGDAISNNPDSLPETYIILDGTWQQAKQMFRKTPALWKLPRVSLTSDVPRSTYVLRGDYSGWKERFGNDADGSNLLCTAEVAAAILDRCGDATSANTIRERLSVFQDSFPHRNDRCDNINKE